MVSYNSAPLIEQNIKNYHSGKFRDPEWLRTTVAYDIETEGLNGAITLAASCGVGWAAAQHQPPPFEVGRPHVMHNAKYDLHQLVREGHPLPQDTIFDTFGAAWLLNENVENGLKPLGKRVLGREWGEWRPDMTKEELEAYALEDVRATFDLFPILYHQLVEQNLLEDYLAIELNIFPLLVEIESRGVKVDTALLEQRIAKAEPRLAELRFKMRDLLPHRDWSCGCDGSGVFIPKSGPRKGEARVCDDCGGLGWGVSFFNSPQQLTQVVFGYLGHKPVVHTENGNPSLTEAAITKLLLKREDSFLRTLLEYRQLAKESGTYYLPYREQHVKQGRIHTDYIQWGPRTGRFASANPNKQNLPPAVRELFIPDEGMKIISADYSQIELYLMGYLSGERRILDAYEAGFDLHERTAGIIGLDRSGGKTINFALPYGLTEGSLASRLNCSKAQAKTYYASIVGGYGTLFKYFEDQKKLARERGYVTTIFNRRRRISGFRDSDYKTRFHAENQAINSPIQGSAADLVKAAMIALKRRLPELQQLGQVHDEVFGQAPAEHAEEIAVEMKHIMENCVPWLKPRVEVKIMERWGK